MAIGTSDGQVIFQITGDNSKLVSTLQDTTRKIQTESNKWDDSVDDSSGNISSSLIGAFKAVTASAAFIKVGQMLLQLGVESVELASDLEEVQNVVDVTFGKDADKIETWATNARNQFGLTELQAKRYASTLGAMMKSSGMQEDEIADISMDLAGLAADMASFYNLDFDEAFTKIQSGMAGMSMPLRQLGIDMTETSVAAFAMAQGYETAFDKMSNEEQTLVRYRYLMSVTADAQGDFARTSDSFANSQRRMQTAFDTLKSQLGEALLPIATTVTNAVNDLLELLVYQPPETAFDVAQESMDDAAESATEAKGILGYMDKLIEKYGDAAEDTDEWATALERLKEVFPDVNKYIDEETGALTATNEQLKEYVENRRQAAIEDAKKAAIQQLNDEYVQAGVDYYKAEINRDLAQAQAEEAALAVIDYIVDYYKEIGLDQDESTKYLTDRDMWLQGLLSGNISMNDLKAEAYGVANERGDNYSTIDTYVGIYEDQTKAASDAATEMNALSERSRQLEADLTIAEAALSRMAAAASNAEFNLNSISTPSLIDGSHAGGLSFVPFDGYIAELHRGEQILTAEEARALRNMNYRSNSLDYDALGGVMRDNVQAGGNVYLEGRTVGKVLSAVQADSYRGLERSGWQG